jgi:hypothetical protein
LTIRMRLRTPDGSAREITMETARAADVTAATPWRTFRSYRGQRHYSGWYWSSTSSDHVIYETRLELARLLLADFDPDVLAIAAQPFLLVEGTDPRLRYHVPDFFLEHRSGACTVVIVKPVCKLQEADIAATLRWAVDAIEAKGWSAQIWSGCEPQLLANVRFLAGYRRPWLFDPGQLTATEAAIRPGDTIGGLEDRLRACGAADPRPFLLHLAWVGRVRVDLSRPLTVDSEIVIAA